MRAINFYGKPKFIGVVEHEFAGDLYKSDIVQFVTNRGGKPIIVRIPLEHFMDIADHVSWHNSIERKLSEWFKKIQRRVLWKLTRKRKAFVCTRSAKRTRTN